MKRINKIILFFFLVIICQIILAVSVLESQWFANKMIAKLSPYIKTTYGVDISFKQIKLEVFPLTTALINVNANFNSPQTSLLLHGEKLAIKFGFLDMLSNRLNITNVELSDGDIYFTPPPSNDRINFSQEQLMPANLWRLYESLIRPYLSTKLKSVGLQNVKFFINDQVINFSFFNITPVEKKLKMNLSFKNFSTREVLKEYEFGDVNIFDLNIELTPKKIDIKNMNLVSDFFRINLKGVVLDDKSSKNQIAVSGKISSDLDGLKKIPIFKNKIISTSGKIILDFNIGNHINNPIIEFILSGKDINSKLFSCKEFLTNGSIDTSFLDIKELKVLDNFGSATIKNLSKIDIKKKNLMDQKIDILFEGIKAETLLYPLKENLGGIKGELYGKAQVEVTDKSVMIKLYNDTKIKNFKLQYPTNKKPILINPELVMRRADFLYELKSNKFLLDTDVEFKNSKFIAKGHVDKKNIEIIARASKIDMEKFGPISGVPLHGVGELIFEAVGPLDDVSLFFIPKMDDFKVVGINLGTIKSKMQLKLNTLDFFISDHVGTVGRTNYKGDGKLRFGDDDLIDLKIDFLNGVASDLQLIFKELLPAKIHKNDLLTFEYNAEAYIKGSLDIKKMEISGKLNALNLILGRETFDKLSTKYLFKNEKLSLKNFLLTKNSGKLESDFLYDFNSSNLETNGSVRNLTLKDLNYYSMFNYGYDASLIMNFSAQGKIPKLKSNVNVKLVNGHIGNMIVSDSSLSLRGSGLEFYGSGKFIDNSVVVDSYLNLDLTKEAQEKKSWIDVAFNFDDFKLLAGMFSLHNFNSTNEVRGYLNAVGKATFNFLSFKDLDIEFLLNDFLLRKGFSRLKLNSESENKIEIKNGKVNQWRLELLGKEDYFLSTASGSIDSDFTMRKKFTLDSSLLEILGVEFQKSSGKIHGDMTILANDSKVLKASLSGKDIYLKLKSVPSSMDKIDFLINAENNKIVLHHLTGKYGRGDISASGAVIMNFPYPELDFIFKVEQSEVPILSRSNLFVSGTGLLRGNSLPYKLDGNFSIVHGEVVEDLSDWISSKSISNKGHDKYLPKENNQNNIGLFDYELSVSILKNITLKNSLMDLKLTGNSKINSGIDGPVINGEIAVIPLQSKIIFKGNDFIIGDGRIDFNNYRTGNDKGIDLRLTASSKISDYDIKMELLCRPDNLSFKLFSEPVLPQEDIFSLLTLGLTANASKILDERERNSVASVGIGTMIVDQLKLNQELNSALGVKVSVMPELEGSNNPLQGTGGTADVTAGKGRAATRIQLQKSIGKNLNVNVASTVGKTSGQKQEMGLNYNINKNIALRGVYEIKSEEENISEESVNAIGADLLFKWSFK